MNLILYLLNIFILQITNPLLQHTPPYDLYLTPFDPLPQHSRRIIGNPNAISSGSAKNHCLLLYNLPPLSNLIHNVKRNKRIITKQLQHIIESGLSTLISQDIYSYKELVKISPPSLLRNCNLCLSYDASVSPSKVTISNVRNFLQNSIRSIYGSYHSQHGLSSCSSLSLDTLVISLPHHTEQLTYDILYVVKEFRQKGYLHSLLTVGCPSHIITKAKEYGIIMDGNIISSQSLPFVQKYHKKCNVDIILTGPVVSPSNSSIKYIAKKYGVSEYTVCYRWTLYFVNHVLIYGTELETKSEIKKCRNVFKFTFDGLDIQMLNQCTIESINKISDIS